MADGNAFDPSKLTGAAYEAYASDPANFDKLSAGDQVRIANQQFGSGQHMGVAATRIIESGIPGANGDGVLEANELQKLKDIRNDKNFWTGVKDVGAATIEFTSVGALSIPSPLSGPLAGPFGMAAIGQDPTPAQPGQTFGMGGPVQNLFRTLDQNFSFTPPKFGA